MLSWRRHLKDGRGRNWDTQLLFPSWFPRSLGAGPQSPQVLHRGEVSHRGDPSKAREL